MVCIKDARNLVRIRASWSRVWLRVTAVAVARRSMKQQLNSRRAMSAAAAAAAAARSDSAARRRGAARRRAAQRGASQTRGPDRSVCIDRSSATHGRCRPRRPRPPTPAPGLPPAAAVVRIDYPLGLGCMWSIRDRTFALPLPTSSVACMPRDGVLPC